jgi:ribosomal protein S18 acetylase RimI-like enzyme
VAGQPLNGLRIGRPSPPDYPDVARVLDDWWERRQVPGILTRLWFEHFSTTSGLARTADGALAGYLVAFHSPDQPGELVLVALAVSPNLRRRGVARRLHDQLRTDAEVVGARRIVAAVFPGDPMAVAFLQASGYRPLETEGTTRLYGVPAFADHEWGREDRAVFILELPAA